MARQLSTAGRLSIQAGQHRRWARVLDRRKATEPARRGFRARFEQQVAEADPDGLLSPDERAERVDQLIHAHMVDMASKAAARQADDIARLEAVLADDGVIVTGSTGQLRVNGVVAELRQGRLALAKLIGQLALPDEDGQAATPAQQRARKAANYRWTRQRQLTAQRAAALESRNGHGAA